MEQEPHDGQVAPCDRGSKACLFCMIVLRGFNDDLLVDRNGTPQENFDELYVSNLRRQDEALLLVMAKNEIYNLDVACASGSLRCVYAHPDWRVEAVQDHSHAVKVAMTGLVNQRRRCFRAKNAKEQVRWSHRLPFDDDDVQRSQLSS